MTRTGQCDFCADVWDPMDHTWQCYHAKPFTIKTEDGTTIDYDEQWLVCQTCDILIKYNTWAALSYRSAESHPDRRPGNLRDLIATAELLHVAFREALEFSHPLHTDRACIIRLPNVQ